MVDLAAATRTVRSNGLSFPVVDVGSGPAVLLLHGFPDDRHLWRYQIPALADAGFRVLAPDLRGFGDAPRPTDPAEYGIPIVIRDVLGILDALGVARVQLVAHDWGAAVGWRLAAEHPDRVERYAAVSVGAPGGPTTIEQREKSWYIAFFRQPGVAEEQLQQKNWQLFREWARNPVDVDRYIANLSRPGALTAALNWYRASGAPPAPGTVKPPPPVVCPVLGIWSNGDAYLTEAPMRTSGERIRGSFQYERISGASHWLMLDKPADLNRLLLLFLKR
ncbi:MAG: alpha/beta hydrolase [Acidobacteria bacterium]|nr:MAG: alpha/beta hydrolase [Acidobacteriota bacterium]PYR48033.1 MAG: alpha/beta hydrolase [Acidobacteriota bacterium]